MGKAPWEKAPALPFIFQSCTSLKYNKSESTSQESTRPQAQYLFKFTTGAKVERFRLKYDFCYFRKQISSPWGQNHLPCRSILKFTQYAPLLKFWPKLSSWKPKGILNWISTQFRHLSQYSKAHFIQSFFKHSFSWEVIAPTTQKHEDWYPMNRFCDFQNSK